MKKTFGTACAIYLALTVIPMAQAVIPYGEIISLKKPGGDFVTLYTLDRLRASSSSVGTNEMFYIEAVDTENGIVALKSVGNGYYVEKEPGGTLMKTIATSTIGNTTHYYWHDVADGVVRLQNINNGNYAQPVNDVLRVNEPSPLVTTEFEWMPLTGARIADTKYSDDTPLYHIDATQPPYNAPTNGIDDATAAIQAALDAASYDEIIEGYAAIVYLPEGRYRLTDTIDIPPYVTLRGDWKRPTETDKRVAGTVMLIEHGEGLSGWSEPASNLTKNVAFILRKSAKMRQLSIYYPNQDVSNVQPYPYTLDFNGEGINVRDITLVNAYEGIFSGSHFPPYAVYWPNAINIYGTPLKTGLLCDYNATTPRYSSLHFTPDYWAESGLDGTTNRQTIINAMRSGGINDPSVALRTGDGDGGTSYVGLEFCGYDIGVQTFAHESPRMFDFKISECRIGMDMQFSKEHGWIITHGAIDAEEVAIRTSASCQTLTINNVSLSSDSKLVEHGSGTLSMMQCTFEDWDLDNHYAIEAFQEDTDRFTYISIVGCDFLQATNHIHINEDVSRALVYGNSPMEHGLDVNNEAGTGKYIVVDTTNYHAFAEMDPLEESVEEMLDVQRQVPRPPAGLAQVFDVTKPPYNAFNLASTSNTYDATDAIQAALDDAGDLADSEAGCIVYVPPGIYRINGRLTVPSHVELRGSQDGGQCTDSRTVLCLFADQGVTNAPAIISLEEQAGIRGFALFRPDQHWSYDRKSSDEDRESAYAYIATNLHAYPFAIAGTDHNWAYDLILCNIYDGIDFSAGGGHELEFIFGTTLNDMVVLGATANEPSVVYNLQAHTSTFQQMHTSRSGYPLWVDSGFGDNTPRLTTDDGGIQFIGTSVAFVGDGKFRSMGHFNNKSFINYSISGSPTLNMYLAGCEGRGIGLLVHSEDDKEMDVEVVGNTYHAYEGSLVTESYTSIGDVLHLFCSKQYLDSETNHIFAGEGHLVVQQDFRLAGSPAETYLLLEDNVTAVVEGGLMDIWGKNTLNMVDAYDNSQAKVCGLLNTYYLKTSAGKEYFPYPWTAQDDDSVFIQSVCPSSITGITGTNGAYAPPSAPTGLSAIAGDACVTLNWNDNSEADLYGYDVYGSAAGNLLYLASVQDNMFTHSSLMNGTTYSYAVIAYDELGNPSQASLQVSATPVDTVAPVWIAAAWEIEPVATGSSTITMKAGGTIDSSGPVEYRFYTYTNGVELARSDWSVNREFNATNLLPGTEYTFALRARDALGNTTTFNAAGFKSATTLWDLLTYDDFEAGWGNWSGPTDHCVLTSYYAVDTQCVNLDNQYTSSATQLSSALDLSGYSQLKIEFTFVTEIFDYSETFAVCYSADGGTNWTDMAEYTNNVHFVKQVRYFVDDAYGSALIIDNSGFTFSDNVLIKFQNRANQNADDLYLDNIRLSAK